MAGKSKCRFDRVCEIKPLLGEMDGWIVECQRMEKTLLLVFEKKKDFERRFFLSTDEKFVLFDFQFQFHRETMLYVDFINVGEFFHNFCTFRFGNVIFSFYEYNIVPTKATNIFRNFDSECLKNSSIGSEQFVLFCCTLDLFLLRLYCFQPDVPIR